MSLSRFFNFDFNLLTPLTLAQTLVAIFLLTLGGVVFFHDKKARVNRMFFLITFPVSVWLIGFALAYVSRSPDQVMFWFKIAYTGVINISFLIYAFSVLFTQARNQKKLIYLGGFLSCFWLILLFVDFPGFLDGIYTYSWGYYPRAGVHYWFFLVYFFFYVLMLGKNLLHHYFKSALGLERQVTLFLFFAFLFAYLGALDFLPTLGITMPTRPLGFVPIAVWIFVVGYTILKYRVWNVKFFAHQTFYYITIYSLIIATYLITFWVALHLLRKDIDTTTLFVSTGLFFVLIITLNHVKGKTQRFIDEIFNPQKINYTTALRKLNKTLSKLVDLEILGSTVTDALQTELSIHHTTLLVFKPSKTPHFICLKSTLANRLAHLPITWNSYRSFFNVLKNSKTISFDELRSYPEYKHLRESGTQLFRLYEARLCVPISCRSVVRGILFLGEHNKQITYDPHFRQELENFAHVFGIALENADLYHQVKTVSDLKSDIITIVSHQLRTPITDMRWGISLLLKETFGTLNQRQKSSLKQLYQSNMETINMVNRLLDLSRLERGVLSFQPKMFDIVPFMQSIVKKMQSVAKNKKITLVFDARRKSLATYGDQDRLGDVFEIIIDNAIKYSRPSKEVRVSIKAARFLNHQNYADEKLERVSGVRVDVIDTGLGVDKEDQSKIFSKFFRGKNANTFDASGLGIGLAFAKSLIELHKGKITIKSALGKGSLISVFIPGKKFQQEQTAKKREDHN